MHFPCRQFLLYAYILTQKSTRGRYIDVEIENLWQQMVLVKTADREMIEQANVCGSPLKYFLRNNSIVQGPGSSSHQL